jgi:hypothetical protein
MKPIILIIDNIAKQSNASDDIEELISNVRRTPGRTPGRDAGDGPR